MNDRIPLLIGVAIFSCIFLLFSWLKEQKKNRQPIYEYQASIYSKSVVPHTVRTLVGVRNIFDYQIQFEIGTGNLIELSAPESFGKYPDGTTGKLTFQGDKCLKFVPDLETCSCQNST